MALDHTSVKESIEKNRDHFLEELFQLLQIPSVSADSKYKKEVLRAAKFLKGKLEELGVEKVELCETAGFPIVYGEYISHPEKPTVLVYGHYDVQPPEPYELWDSPPFEPVIKNGKIFARGACDDKGQMYMHVKALETMQELGELPCNVKFLLEGEEEVGSINLENFVREKKAKLAADVILISDTGMLSMETPSITVGLRGMSYLEVEITGPNRDLHSGTYGGAVANPINILCKMISALKDENNRVAVPKFYDKVVELSSAEREQLNAAPFDLEFYKKELNIGEVEGEKGFTTFERIGIRPTLDVNGIWGGYTGEGAKTVLPSKANAKISMRLVPNQNSVEINQLFTKYFSSLAPKSVRVKVTPLHGGEPAVLSTKSESFQAAKNAFEEGWGKKPIPTRDGGSIPIVSLFQKVLGLDSIMLGFGLDSDAIHSPNESFGVFNYLKGIETIVLFHKHYAQIRNVL